MSKKIGTLVIFIILIILFSFRVFSLSYENLEISIDNERSRYIEEIENQLVSRSNEIRNDIENNLHFISVLLNENPPTSFSDVKHNYNKLNDSDNFEFILVSKSGKCYRNDGSLFSLEDKDLLEEIVIYKEEVSKFIRLPSGDNYLITSKNITPFTIEDEEITSIILATTETHYRERMTLPLFNKYGMSFVCDNEGRLLINPEYDRFSIMGYNLFISLLELGVNDKVVNQIINDFSKGESNYKYFQIEEKWLIQYAAFNEGKEYIISLIPVSVVSNELISDVSKTIQMAYFSLFSIFILFIVFIIIIYRILAERDKNKFESQIREKEATSRSEFLSQMSHDMRTPLSAIVGISNIAKDNVNNPQIINDSITKINSSANYILEIINDILDLSKLEGGKLKLNEEPFCLNDVIYTIEAINQPRAKEKDLFFNIIKNYNADSWYIGDKLRLSQILMNLISNAIKFTPENGNVKILVESQKLNSDTDNLIINVSDTGIGMSKEFLDKLFVPYEQENLSISSLYGGSGLGLSIVDNLIKLMNGKIKVKSEKSVGTEFQVILKLKKSIIIEKQYKEECDLFDFSKLSVLYIEDHPINRLVGEKQLKSIGINKIDTVENGLKGLEYFYKNPANYYSLIITDIRMPLLDGYQLIQRIRKSNRKDNYIPIITMSANSKDEEIKSEYKIDASLCKPVQLNELKETICKIVK
ncbi:MAG: ATP-binding protein [Sphaerochaetaceae bacterium]|nr:ATP-binding protein [Sphaerochaetaceae bacterium]